MPDRPYAIDQMISAKAIAARLEALAREIQAARAIAGGRGLLAVNVMRAVSDYAASVRTALAEGIDALVVGAGLSGIGAAVHLQKHCPERNFAILEGRDRLGGTWDLFRYPGIRSDSDMFSFGYQFRPWHELKILADGPSIRQYIRDVAAASRVPVLNMQCDVYHPCQILADIFTFIEHRGCIQDKTVAWVGDANNMCNTWLQAAEVLGFNVHVSTPPGYEINADLVGKIDPARFKVFSDPMDACRGADLVTTDVWTSMGYEAENEVRRAAFADWCVNAGMMAVAKPDALFMHCLPAHRGEEVATDVIDGPQSVVWDEAENRMHVQKALMEYLLLGQRA